VLIPPAAVLNYCNDSHGNTAAHNLLLGEYKYFSLLNNRRKPFHAAISLSDNGYLIHIEGKIDPLRLAFCLVLLAPRIFSFYPQTRIIPPCMPAAPWRA